MEKAKIEKSETQAEFSNQPETTGMSEKLSDIAKTNHDIVESVNLTVASEDDSSNDGNVSSQGSISSQDKEFYQLVHRDSQTLENSSTVEENIAAEEILISWNQIPMSTKTNGATLVENSSKLSCVPKPGPSGVSETNTSNCSRSTARQ